MPDRLQGARSKPSPFFWTCRAFSQPENGEMAYLFGNGASSMGTFFFCLSASLEGHGREKLMKGQCLGAAGPLGLQRSEPGSTPSSPSLGQASEAFPAGCCLDLVLQTGNMWHLPGPTEVTCLPASSVSPCNTPDTVSPTFIPGSSWVNLGITFSPSENSSLA